MRTELTRTNCSQRSSTCNRRFNKARSTPGDTASPQALHNTSHWTSALKEKVQPHKSNKKSHTHTGMTLLVSCCLSVYYDSPSILPSGSSARLKQRASLTLAFELLTAPHPHTRGQAVRSLGLLRFTCYQASTRSLSTRSSSWDLHLSQERWEDSSWVRLRA